MKLLGAGDNVVDRYIRQGYQYPGGNAVNVAVYTAQLGGDASYMGVVGDDDSGRFLLSSLKDEGVHTDLIRVAHGPTAYALVDLVDSDRVFRGSFKGVALFTPTRKQLDTMKNFDVVHAGYASSLLPSIQAMAKQTRISFDFGSKYALTDVETAMPDLFLATFSGGKLSEEKALQSATDAVNAGAQMGLVTLGSRGAVLATRTGHWFEPARPVDLVDTLGAGDAFIAGFLQAVIDGSTLQHSLQSGAENAARICTVHGAFGHRAELSEGAQVTEEIH